MARPARKGVVPKGFPGKDMTNFTCIQLGGSQLKSESRELSILLDMSKLLSSSMDLQVLLSRALEEVLTHFPFHAGRIYLMEDDAKALYLAAYLGMEPEGLERIRADEGFTGRAARTGSFIIQNVSALDDLKRRKLLRSKDFKVVACVPLIIAERVVGVMNLASRKMIMLNRADMDLLTAIGNQLAVAVDHVRIYEELESKIQAVQEKKDMIKFFAYSISHDLKSPAVGLHGIAERLLYRYGDSLGDKGRVYCEMILRACSQITALVENLNAYISSREAPLKIEKVDSKEIMRRVREKYDHEIRQRGVIWTESADLPEIMADRLGLERIFHNLADNALKYGGEEMMHIEIGYREETDFHVFTFSDDGAGIPPDAREKIFERFHRNHSGEKPGTGLGLSIVREIARRHGGTAWMQDGQDKGVTFYVSLAKKIS